MLSNPSSRSTAFVHFSRLLPRHHVLKGTRTCGLASLQTAFTLKEIASSWPYMVETSKATGGGDVPAFQWIVIDEDKDFYVEGIKVSPLNGPSHFPSLAPHDLSR